MPKWDYVCVNLVRSYGQNYRRNGIKMSDWKDKPLYEVMQVLGDEGFEFSAFDGQNYIFKKAIGVPQTQQPLQRPPQPAQAGQPGQQRPPQNPAGQPAQAPQRLAPPAPG